MHTHTPKERGEEKERKTEIKNEQMNDRKKDQKHNVTHSKTMVGTGKNLWNGCFQSGVKELLESLMVKMSERWHVMSVKEIKYE